MDTGVEEGGGESIGDDAINFCALSTGEAFCCRTECTKYSVVRQQKF